MCMPLLSLPWWGCHSGTMIFLWSCCRAKQLLSKSLLYYIGALFSVLRKLKKIRLLLGFHFLPYQYPLPFLSCKRKTQGPHLCAVPWVSKPQVSLLSSNHLSGHFKFALLVMYRVFSYSQQEEWGTIYLFCFPRSDSQLPVFYKE